jgi:adenylate kinase family enzyme
MSSPYIAIIFIGFPGIGKTAVGKKVATFIPNMVHIEQDQFYSHRKSDTQAYLHAIKKAIQSHHVVLGKNHHNQKNVQEVIDVLTRYQVRYLVFNFVPEHITQLPKEDQSVFITHLLDRIEQRSDASSPLCITSEQSRSRAKQIIVHGFLNKYEEPTMDYIQLDYLLPIDDHVMTIIQCIRKTYADVYINDT